MRAVAPVLIRVLKRGVACSGVGCNLRKQALSLQMNCVTGLHTTREH